VRKSAIIDRALNEQKAARSRRSAFLQVGYRNCDIGGTINSCDTSVAFGVLVPGRRADGLISCRNKRYNLSRRTHAGRATVRVTRAGKRPSRYLTYAL